MIAAEMKLLLVEDEASLARSLGQGLREEGHQVDVCRTGAEALRQAKDIDYDAVVLDWMLPDLDGVTILRTWRDQGLRTPVLMLTARGSVGERVTGLRAGADDYLVKPFAFAELLARLRALLRRGTSRPSLLEVGDLRVDLVARRAERAGVRLDLTAKEFALLEYLARHAGEVVTRTMISEHVWDMNFDSFSNVIDVYIRYLRRKIDEPFATKLIHTRRGVGYILGVEP